MSLAILCPGQGGQHPAMYARVCADQRAGAVLEIAAAILAADPQHVAADPQRYLNRIAQPLVCSATLAHWQALHA
jgi:[acyl-carrier-protein] S-malonyltransferase